MPSLPWICERIARARAITVAAVGRWPAQLLEAVLEAYRQGAVLVVYTAPGYELGTVHAFLDLGLSVRHTAVGTPGLLVLDQREGWLVGSYLPVDHPRLSIRALEHARVAEWVRFHGRIHHIDPAGHTFTIEGFPHVTLYGALPAAAAIPGAFVRVTGLRSLALGEEAYHPHSLQVVEIVPRAQDALVHRLDLAVQATALDAGDPPAPEWEAILRQRGFACPEDLETYLLDHGISRGMVSGAIAEVAPDSPPAVTSATMILVAGILQTHPATAAPLAACTPILRALIRSASSADLAAGLTAATQALLDRAPRGLWVVAAQPTEALFDRLSVLSLDLGALCGETVGTSVIAPEGEADRGPAGRPSATIHRFAAALASEHARCGIPGVLVAVDAAAWTQSILATGIAHGPLPPVRIGLHTGLRGQVDLCLPRYVRRRVAAGAGGAPLCGALEAITLLVRALRITRDARLRELRGPSGPIVPRTGSA